MKTSYVVRAEKMIKRLMPYIEDAFHTYEGFTLAHEIRKIIKQFNSQKNLHMEFKYGSTRGVFICSDYVIKFDLSEEHSEFGDCCSEYNTYCFVQNSPYEKWFTKITPCQVNYLNFWIMPRASRVGGCENWDSYIDKTSLNFITRMIDDLHMQNIGWLHGHPVIIDYACRRTFDYDESESEAEDDYN